jgi:hypothetical protein
MAEILLALDSSPGQASIVDDGDAAGICRGSVRAFGASSQGTALSAGEITRCRRAIV